MNEAEKAKKAETEPEAIRDDLSRRLTVKGDRFEIMRLSLDEEWPDGLAVYYALRREKHGRIFYHYVCYKGEIYSPFAPDGLERLLKRMLDSRRFELNAVQLANLLLMYNRPEPMMMLVTDIERDIAPSAREFLEREYEIKDLAPQLIRLDEDCKLVFWTFNLRREVLKYWTAYIADTGRLRIIEEGTIELRIADFGLPNDAK